MRILYLTTTFPVYSETFLQREARAMIKAGVGLEIVSLHRGEVEFEGTPIYRFNKWSLFKLFYLLPIKAFTHGRELLEVIKQLNSRTPPSLLNFAENLLGLGSAIVIEKRVRQLQPDIIHCVWSSAPAASGLMLKALTGIPFSTGAHAYDIFEHGGDWLLNVKLERASLVHVSTDVAVERIRKLCDAQKVKRIRRGLSVLPEPRAPRLYCRSLRIVCVARLVEKKGFPYQIAIYKLLKERGISFRAKIVGDGPMENEIRTMISEAGVGRVVSLTGRLSESETLEQLQWADLLFHTGVVAASGDRDGLPNVVPEAMASGAVVVGSPVSGVVEAIQDGVTGFLCPPWEPECWVKRCVDLQRDASLRVRVSETAREWVEREFVADTNTGHLLELLEKAIEGESPPPRC